MSTGEDDGGYSESLQDHADNCPDCRNLSEAEQEACFQAEQDNLQAAHEAWLDDEADRTNDERWADGKADEK